MKTIRAWFTMICMVLISTTLFALPALAVTHQTAGTWNKTSAGTTFDGSMNVVFTDTNAATATGNFSFDTSTYTIGTANDFLSVSNTKNASNDWTSVITGYSILDGGIYSGELVETTLTCTKTHLGACTVHMHVVDCDQMTGLPNGTVILDTGTAGVPENSLGNPTGLTIQ